MQVPYQAHVEAFLACQHIAVVGYSRHPQSVANAIYQKLADHGYAVYAVNPQPEQVPAVPCYASLADLPVQVEAVMICTPPEASLQVVQDAEALGIQHLWVHRSLGDGSYQPTLTAYAAEHGLSLIAGGCPMMFVEPDIFHRCLRWWVDRQGKLVMG